MIWELYANLENGMVWVEFNAAKGEHYLRTQVGTPFDFRLAISDALRCLRSALDYLVAALARAKDIRDDNVTFPFNAEREKIVSAFRISQVKKGKREGALFKVGQAYPDLKDIILNEIQPYSASDGAGALGDFLWRLITMDNIDKHRLLTPTITFTHIKEGHVAGTVNLKNVGLSNWGPTGPAPIVVAGAPADAKSNLNFSADVVFPDRTRLAGKPVISSFVEGANMVARVIELFESHFEGKK